jgi:hypothetical protein
MGTNPSSLDQAATATSFPTWPQRGIVSLGQADTIISILSIRQPEWGMMLEILIASLFVSFPFGILIGQCIWKMSIDSNVRCQRSPLNKSGYANPNDKPAN